MKDYIQKILLPYISKKRKELKLSPENPALVHFDKLTGQETQELFDLLQNNNVNIVVVPANCTDRLQLLDVSVNKPVKEFLCKQFYGWYAEQISKQLHTKESQFVPVDLKLSTMKPSGAQWMIKLQNYLKTKPELLQNGFREVGITGCLSS